MTSVAVVQVDAGGDRAAARESAVAAIGRAADAGARLVVLPEYASGWAPAPGPDLVEPLDGPFVTAVREAARRAGVSVVVGVVAPHGGDDPRAVNLALAIGPDGALLGSYAKVHLFDAFGWRESDALAPGAPDAEPLVIDVDGLRVGVLTCYDLRFPESARRLADAGSQVLVAIAAWASGPGKAGQLAVLARARAIENTAYLLLASQCGPGRTGHSAVVDPLGEVLAEATEDGEEILLANLDPAAVAAARERVPVLRHRRYAVVPLA